MTRIVHLTDLHFGFARQDLEPRLVRAVNDWAPGLVVCTGDMGHRARSRWMREARRFMDRLDAPWITVPGNHDVPLYDLVQRFSRPFHAYGTAFPGGLDPVARLDDLCVIGANTTDPRLWQRGSLGRAQIDRICALAESEAATGRTVILAVHHPLEHHPRVDKELTVNAAEAMARFESCGVRVVLSGHLHRWFAEYFIDGRDRRILQVQGGTALCDRASDRQNEFAVLDFDGPDLTIHRVVAPMDCTGFAERAPIRLSRRGGFWRLR